MPCHVLVHANGALAYITLSRTVEQRIVRQPDAAAEQDEASESSEGALGWSAAAAAAELLGPAGEFVLDALPGFLGVGGRHGGGWIRWIGWDGDDGEGAVGGEVDEKMAAKPKLRLAGMVLSPCQASTPGAGRRVPSLLPCTAPGSPKQAQGSWAAGSCLGASVFLHDNTVPVSHTAWRRGPKRRLVAAVSVSARFRPINVGECILLKHSWPKAPDGLT